MKPIFVVRTLEPFRAASRLNGKKSTDKKVSSLYSAPIIPGQKQRWREYLVQSDTESQFGSSAYTDQMYVQYQLQQREMRKKLK